MVLKIYVFEPSASAAPNTLPSSLVAMEMGMGMPAWPEVGAGLLSHLLTKGLLIGWFYTP